MQTNCCIIEKLKLFLISHSIDYFYLKLTLLKKILLTFQTLIYIIHLSLIALHMKARPLSRSKIKYFQTIPFREAPIQVTDRERAR